MQFITANYIPHKCYRFYAAFGICISSNMSKLWTVDSNKNEGINGTEK
jgi:hypothetical protein